jgi:hypothetical protein
MSWSKSSAKLKTILIEREAETINLCEDMRSVEIVR